MSVAVLVLLTVWIAAKNLAFALDPNKRVTQYALRTWTTDDGLPQGWITALLQTHDGFLWVGTKGGLTRFDGVNFKVFRSSEPNSIPQDTVTSLAEDNDGNVWIGTPGGLTRYHDGRFTTYTARDGLPETSIARLTHDNKDGIWIVTSYSHLVRFDGHHFTVFNSPITGSFGEVNTVLEDHDGTVWMATFHGLLAFKNGALDHTYTQTDGLPGNAIYALCLDQQGVLWTAGAGGVASLHSGRFVPQPIAGLDFASFVSVDHQGNLWTGSTGSGLYRVNSRGTSRLTAAQGLTSDEIYTILEARDGGIWLGAVSGLNQLQDSIFISFGSPEGLPFSTRGLAAVEESDHAIWLGGDRTRIRIEGDKIENFGIAYGHSLYPYVAQGATPSERGMLSVTSAGDVFLVRPHSQLNLGKLNLNGTGAVFYDRNGVVWLGTNERGLIRIDAQGHSRSYTTHDGLPDNNVRVLNEAPNGDLWVGTASGLVRLHKDQATRIASCEVVTSIWIDEDGSVWASSQSGLIHYHEGAVHLFTQREGLPTDVIEGVAGDTLSHLWLGTLQGVLRINKQQLHAVEQKKAASLSPIVFGRSDGLRDTEVRQNSVFRSQDGNIWFMTLKELASVHPGKALPAPKLTAYIEDISLDDKPISPGAPFIVPPGRHRIQLHFTSPNLSSPARTRFRYRLEGWDRGWVDAGSNRDASYTGIPAGHYRFRVMVSNGWGEWSPTEAEVSIAVNPYFYQTLWFLAACLIVLTTVVAIVHNLRVSQLESHLHDRLQERLEERTRIARELHDTLLQGVIGMLMQLYAVEMQVDVDSPARTGLVRIVGRAHKLVEEGRMTLEDLRSEAPHENALEEALLLSIGDFDIPDSVQVKITTTGIPQVLNTVVQGDVYRIAREALINALKHAQPSLIAIEVGYSESALRLRVWDNGQGIYAEHQEADRLRHWGIQGMRERAEHIGGQLKISSRPAAGTEVELRIPARLAYKVSAESSKIKVLWARTKTSLGKMRKTQLKDHTPDEKVKEA